MPDEGRTQEEGETDTAVSAHPGHACPATRDRSLDAHHWSLQVEQAQVSGNVEQAVVYLCITSFSSQELLS